MANEATIIGVPALDAKLRRLKPALTKKIVKNAARIALKPMLKTARSNAPVRTGEMRKNIKIRTVNRRGRYGARLSTLAKHAYGVPQEYGYKTRSGGQVAPKHFMKKAFDSHKQEARETLKKEVVAGIERWAVNG